MHKIEGIELADVVKLTEMVRSAGERVIEHHSLPWTVTRVEEMGLRLDYDSAPGPVITRHYLKGRRWTVWFDMGNAQFRATDGAATLVKWLSDKYQRVLDWEFSGDSDDFYTDMTTARMFGYV